MLKRPFARSGEPAFKHALQKVCALTVAFLPLIANASQEARFWDWFIANEPALYRFTSPSDPLVNQLGSQLQQVNRDLTFQIGLSNQPGGRRELIISADGLKAAFPAVEALYAAAPKLAHWDIIKYRAARDPMTVLTLQEQVFDPARVLCVLVRDGDKLGVVLMHEHFDPHNDVFTQASYLLLDEALGEYVMETEVGIVHVQGKEARWLGDAFPMTALAAQFKAARQQPASVQ